MLQYHLIDSAHREHLPGLMNLYSESYAGRGHPRLVLMHLEGGHFFFLASKNHEPIAFVTCLYQKNKRGKKRIEIESYYTTPKHRREGLAKRLSAKVVLKARAEKMEVVSIPYPSGHIPRMVRSFQRMQEIIPKEARAVQMRTRQKSGRTVFRIKPKRKMK